MKLSMNKGSDNGRSKLNESDVINIHQRIKDGEKLADISQIFGVSKETISAIKTGRNWKHLLDSPSPI